jgi:nucleoid DNA-binding protein
MANVQSTATEKEDTSMKSTKTELKQEMFGDLKEVRKVVKKAFDNGTKSVGEVCQTVAEMQLKYFGKIDKLERPVNDVREIQTKAIGNVVDLVRSVSDKVDDITGLTTEKMEKLNFMAPWIFLLPKKVQN